MGQEWESIQTGILAEGVDIQNSRARSSKTKSHKAMGNRADIKNRKPTKNNITKNRNTKTTNRAKRTPIRFFFYACLIFLIASAFIIVPYLNVIGVINGTYAMVFDSMALSLMFSFIVFSYLFAKGRSFKEIIEELGLSRKNLTVRYVKIGIILFLLFFLMEFALGLFTEVTGIQLPTNVQQYLSNMPLFFYFFVFLVAPINEEILFRGFMVPRTGIIISALVFGFLHYLSYFSIVEAVAAFAFGIAAGYVFKKTKSLYPSIIGHMLFDFVGVLSLIFS